MSLPRVDLPEHKSGVGYIATGNYQLARKRRKKERESTAPATYVCMYVCTYIPTYVGCVDTLYVQRLY